MQGCPIWTVQISLYFFFLSQSLILGTPDKIEGTVTASKKIITWNLFPTYIPLDIGKVNPTTGFNKIFLSRLRFLPQNRSIAMQRFDSIHIPEATDGQQLQNLHK